MKARHWVVIWFALGAVYLVMEGVWRMGWTHIAMLPVGGLCGLCVGAMNQSPRFYRRPMWVQCLAGAAAILVIELAAGLVINRWLGLGVWDYSHHPGNVLGQICLQYGVLWFLLVPFAIWAEDTARFALWAMDFAGTVPEPEYGRYRLWTLYRDLFMGR